VIGDRQRIIALLMEMEARTGAGGSFAGLLADTLGTHPPASWLELLPEPALATSLGKLLEDTAFLLNPRPTALVSTIAQLGTGQRKRDRNLRLGLARVMVLQGERAAAVEQELDLSNKTDLGVIALLERFAAGDYRGAADLGDALVESMKARKYKQLGDIEGVIHALVRIVSMEANPARVAALRQSLENSAAARCAHLDIYESLSQFEH